MSIFSHPMINHDEKRTDFNGIVMSLASPEKVRSWSYGEVRLPETINYRSFKPEPGGLFCAKIFGPIKDYECLCGKYKRIKHRNIICEKCGVEVTMERVRRERMGHINLACPVAHILFFKSVPSRIGLMMNLTMRDIERVLYFEAYVVLDPRRLSELDKGQLINTDQYNELVDKHGSSAFSVGIGAEGLRSYLMAMDLEKEASMLRAEIENAKGTKELKLFKRLRIVEHFRLAKQRPEWMILDALPVLPPGLRPLVQLAGGKFTTSDLNELYRRVINRNNRLRRLLELDAPNIIINNEKRMLQEAVDSLLDNGRRGKPAVGPNKRPLKSLADGVKGKSGRFRQNLLGKRVDFSARSVIVVGPNLKLHQCGLPKEMALNLFRPFVFNVLVSQGYVGNIKQARTRVDAPDGEVWDILETVIRQHPIMLNRAPTLHRLGIQAFEPVLIEGKAIQLHPLVCAAFNADFDGDQMAVHVPLSLEAQAEARLLMLSANNILAPANGEPVTLPTQDIVLGIYYATRERQNAPGEGMRFANHSEIETALGMEAVHLQAKIKFPLAKRRLMERVAPKVENEEDEFELVDTTVGRVLLLSFLPDQMPFSLINRTLKKKDLGELVNKIFRHCGLRETVIFCDRLMRFGFRQSTMAGISICMDDMTIPSRKKPLVAAAEQEMQEAQQQFRDGLLTEDERYNKSVDLWDKAGEEISREMMRELSFEPVLDVKTGEVVIEKGVEKMQASFNSLYMMADSGARGSQTQIKQLAGMRGLMTKPDGRIMETAITANFREGLTVLQYFLSTHGARKGLSDTALKTANSGYLTRRLVDVAQDTVIVAHDCGTRDGIVMRAVLMGGEVIVPLSDRILGRVVAQDVVHPQTGQVLYAAGTLMNEAEAEAVADAGVDEVVVRSPVVCDMPQYIVDGKTRWNVPNGLCVKCYGRDLGRGRLVQMGEAVGVIAAQSIGEPGTQLTMRTFHIGGAASRAVMTRSVEAKSDGELRIHARYVTNSRGELVIVSRGGEMSVHDKEGRERERYRLQYGEVLRVRDGGHVRAGQQVSHRDPLTRPIITEHGGTVHMVGLDEGFNARRQTDELTGLESWVVTEDKRPGKKAVPVLMKFRDEMGRPVCIRGTETEVSITLRPDTTILAHAGKVVSVGDVVATMPQEAGKSRDITGGLPRVAELFEAREPKESSLLSPANGRVELRGVVRQKQILVVIDHDEIEHEIVVPKGRNVLVQDGMEVKKGEEIVEGDPNPHEILAMRGIKALTAHIVDEVQAVYRLQGVSINDKHIEVIVHQMLRSVEVDEPGDSRYMKGDRIVQMVALEEDKRLREGELKPMRYHHVLLGITKASLATDSFISAASFQETARVLTEAAVAKRSDKLRGLKENIVVGRLIPAGTGFIERQNAQGGRERLGTVEAEEVLRRGLVAQQAAEESAAPVASVVAAEQEGAAEAV